MVGFPQACCEYPNDGCLSVCVQFETGIRTGFMVSSVNMYLQERVLTTPILYNGCHSPRFHVFETTLSRSWQCAFQNA